MTEKHALGEMLEKKKKTQLVDSARVNSKICTAVQAKAHTFD